MYFPGIYIILFIPLCNLLRNSKVIWIFLDQIVHYCTWCSTSIIFAWQISHTSKAKVSLVYEDNRKKSISASWTEISCTHIDQLSSPGREGHFSICVNSGLPRGSRFHSRDHTRQHVSICTRRYLPLGCMWGTHVRVRAVLARVSWCDNVRDNPTDAFRILKSKTILDVPHLASPIFVWVLAPL